MENERLSPTGFERIKGDEMKNFNEDMTEDVPIIEKRNRRRSSVFAEVRKSLLESRKANQSFDLDFEGMSPEEAKVTKYVEELRKEKREWLDVTNKRKLDYESANKKYSEHCKRRRIMTEKECLPYLVEQDKKYLKDLPKFETISLKYCLLRKSQGVFEDQRRRNIKVAMQLLNLITKDTEVKKQNIRKYSEIQTL
ncbi:uncharacterized protein [Hetaerina americana]|uniref:uncharacterized protein n=1 Tax=Hetaerina americana TaxID=62018 RepID=UPI003A7F4390